MANKDIHISIGSSFSGEGFRQLDTALKSSANGVKRAIAPVDAALRTFSDMGGKAGQAFGIAGKFLTGFATMGVWGVLIASLSSVVGWFMKLKEGAKDAALAARGLSREYMTLEAAAAGYNRRMERMKKAADEAKKAESDRAKAAAKAAEELKKTTLENERKFAAKKAAESNLRTARLQNELLTAENPYAQAQVKVKMMAEAAQNNVQQAQLNLNQARQGGNKLDIERAQIELETAKERRKTAKEEARQMLIEVKRAEIAAKKKQKAEEERVQGEMLREHQMQLLAEERERIQAIMEKTEKTHAEKVAEIDRRISDARSRAETLEQNASEARGISVDDWLKNRRNAEREQRREERRQAGRMKNAQEELDRLTNPRTRRVRSDWEKKRIADLREWIADQDPNNNPALQEAQRLEAEKRQMEIKKLAAIEAMKATLENLTAK